MTECFTHLGIYLFATHFLFSSGSIHILSFFHSQRLSSCSDPVEEIVIRMSLMSFWITTIIWIVFISSQNCYGNLSSQHSYFLLYAVQTTRSYPSSGPIARMWIATRRITLEKLKMIMKSCFIDLILSWIEHISDHWSSKRVPDERSCCGDSSLRLDQFVLIFIIRLFSVT